MQTKKIAQNPLLINSIKKNFQDLKSLNFLSELKNWQAQKKAGFKQMLIFFDSILSELQQLIAFSSGRNKTILRLFQNIQTRFQLPNSEYCNFSLFAFKKSKKSKNLKRVISQNTDLVDFLTNFRDETFEIPEGLIANEENSRKTVEKNNNEIDFKIREDKIRTSLNNTRALFNGVTNEFNSFEMRFANALNSLDKNMHPTVSKELGLPEFSRRNSLELLSSLFFFTRTVHVSFRNLWTLVCQILSSFKEFESENISKIKQALSFYIDGLNSFFGNSTKPVFSKTIALLEKLQLNIYLDELFDFEGLLPVEDLEIFKKQIGSFHVNEFILGQFVTNSTMENFNPFLERLTLDTWRGLFIKDDSIPVQTIFKLTCEGTIIMYRFDSAKNELLHFKTMMLENGMILNLEDEKSIKFCFFEGVANKSPQLLFEFIFDDKTKNEFVRYIQTGLLSKLKVDDSRKAEFNKMEIGDLENGSLKSVHTLETTDDNFVSRNISGDNFKEDDPSF